jgi:hypothetical protein
VTSPDPRDDRLRLALALHASRAGAAPTPACLDDDAIAAFAEGSVDPAVRATALPHLAGCARCREAVASVARALTDPDVGREAAALETRGRGRLWRVTRIVVPLAAASVIVMLSWPPPRDRDDSRHRAPTITAAQPPVPVSPVGAVADARRLVWTSTVGADRYRVTLFDSAGSVVFETQLGDTTTLVPDSVALASGRRYLWKVEARTDLGRWTASDLVDFSVPAGARR